MYENNYPNDFQGTGENNATSACQNEGIGQTTEPAREAGNTYVYHTQPAASAFQSEKVQEPVKKEKKEKKKAKKAKKSEVE